MKASTDIQPGNLIALHFLLGVVIFVVIGTIGAIYIAARDNHRRRERLRQYRLEQERSAADFRIRVANRAAEILAKQKTDQPAVTVPVTNAERQERRRLLKLYHDLDR